MNVFGTGVMAYEYYILEYLCVVKSYVAWDSIHNRLPYEAFW